MYYYPITVHNIVSKILNYKTYTCRELIYIS